MEKKKPWLIVSVAVSNIYQNYYCSLWKVLHFKLIKFGVFGSAAVYTINQLSLLTEATEVQGQTNQQDRGRM